MTNDQHLVDEDGKPNPSQAVVAISRALQQSRTGQVYINWDMAIRSLPGLCVAVGDNATHLDKANDIDFPAAVEVKNEMALQELRFPLPRDGAEELLAELNALGRSA